MTIVINLGLHTGCIGSIFIAGIFGNFYTKRGGIFDFQNGNSRWPCRTPTTFVTCGIRADPLVQIRFLLPRDARAKRGTAIISRQSVRLSACNVD